MNTFTAPIRVVHDEKKILLNFSDWHSFLCSYLKNGLVDVRYYSYPAVYDDGRKKPLSQKNRFDLRIAKAIILVMFHELASISIFIFMQFWFIYELIHGF